MNKQRWFVSSFAFLYLSFFSLLSPSAHAFPLHAPGEKPEASGIELETGGSLRMRYEWKRGFALGTPSPIDPQDYLLSQLRLHAKLHHADDWAIYVEGQDARVNGAFLDNGIADKRSPNTFADAMDLHQAYLDLGWGDSYGARVRVGRQKFNLGALRMVASLEWVNTARVWDGLRLTQHLGAGRSVDAFASRLVPVRPERFNSHALTGNRMFDSRFHGIYYTDTQSINSTRIEPYYLLRENHHAGDRVHTLGLRYAWRSDAWDSDGELMGQAGRFGFLRHRAYAAHLGLGRQLDDRLHLGLAYNLGSGDGNAGDGTHTTFDNLYPLNHAYYGYMDFFSLMNVHNPEAVLTWKADEKSTLRLAFEEFRLVRASGDAWYNAGGGVLRRAGGSAPSRVGEEVDFTASTTLNAWPVHLLLCYSHFFAGPYIRATGTSADADFVFFQSKWSF
ncbi:MAG: alginate export family protein [Mariprofundaceae bacterium]|nr:alginate export family protein [Mariprofundaceae bacterium]